MKDTKHIVYPHVFTPLHLANITIRNRILVAAHSYGYADRDGIPTPQLLAYIEERAKGGVGLIIMGETAVAEEGYMGLGMTINIDDKIVPHYKNIADAVHSHGGRIFDQLAHAGGQIGLRNKLKVFGPSAVPHPRTLTVPSAMTKRMVLDVIKSFGAAARRCQEGGLDGVEIKADQGFLLHQFLSPRFNLRSDEYGGSFGNRIRFVVDILNEVRARVGSDYIVGIRLTGDSMLEGDLSINDTKRILASLESTQHLDYIHVNGATNSTLPGYLASHGDMTIPSANFADFTRAIKQTSSLPIFMTSMVREVQVAERLLEVNVADMIAMTRPHIADPELVNKAQYGRVDDIRLCIYCNQECVGNAYQGRGIKCIYNAAAGREEVFGIGTLVKTRHRKNILIVGGGPAGLEAARVAATRGHNVELYEKNSHLGGQIRTAAMAANRHLLNDIVDYLSHQVYKNNIDVHLGSTLTEAEILALNADVVVLATGSRPYKLVETGNSKVRVLDCFDMLNEVESTGEQVLIVDTDWKQHALSLAETLAVTGRKVFISSPSFYVGDGLDIVNLTSFYSRLSKLDVIFLPRTEFVRIDSEGVLVRDVLSREEQLIAVDTTVFATGAVSDNGIARALEGKVKRLFTIGDCHVPATISQAIYDAQVCARAI